MCIVPIRLKHKSWKNKELEIYAMLDECSDGTFIDEKLLSHFGEDLQRKTEITVETVAADTTGMSVALKDLVVRGAVELGEEARYQVKLPEVFSQRKLPMSKKDITAAADIADWSYLEKVAQTLPGVKDIPLGMIIGNNCPKALEPMEVIPSRDGGPYATRRRLGWCVSAPGKESETGAIACNRIRVVETRIKETAIGDALLQMWREDFVEKDSEKKAPSREDTWFLNKMQESIGYSQGHYVLPLPLRKKTLTIQSDEKTWSEDNSSDARLLDKKVIAQAGMAGLKQSESREIVSIASREEIQELSKGTYGSTKTGKEIVIMPENRDQALQRARSLKRKMMKEEGFRKEYSTFVEKLLASGYAEKVPEERLRERAWYLPHHGVFHPTKKKIRVVFDCSAKKG